MTDETYKIPDDPKYNIGIRKIQNTDPVKASTVVNPVIERLIENTAAVKGQADLLTEDIEVLKAQTDKLTEDTSSLRVQTDRLTEDTATIKAQADELGEMMAHVENMPKGIVTTEHIPEDMVYHLSLKVEGYHLEDGALILFKTDKQLSGEYAAGVSIDINGIGGKPLVGMDGNRLLESGDIAANAWLIACYSSGLDAYVLQERSTSDNGGSADLATLFPVVIGRGSSPSADNIGVAIGSNAKALGHQTIAVGDNVASSGTYSATFGFLSNSSGDRATAVGCGVSASGKGASVFGNMSNAHGDMSVAIGSNCQSDHYGVAVGRSSSASPQAVALGTFCNADLYSIAIGTTASAVGVNSVAIGQQAISQLLSLAIGDNANAFGNAAIAIGGNSKADISGIAIGTSAASSSTAVALGPMANASANASTAVGSRTNARYDRSTALGYNAMTSAENTIRIGSSNSSEYSALYSLRNITVSSDQRDKTDIQPIRNSLDFLNSIKTVQYVDNSRTAYTKDELTTEQETLRDKYNMHQDLYDTEAHAKGLRKGERKRVGVLAQDVQEKMREIYGTDNYAELVHDNLYDRKTAGEEFPEGVESMLCVNYTSFIPFLIQAVQELSLDVNRLREEKNER